MEKKQFLLVITSFIIVAVSLLFLHATKNKELMENELYTYETVHYQEHTFDIVKVKKEYIPSLHFYLKDEQGDRFASIDRLKSWLERKNQILLFATNGGIFDPGGIPKGIYIEKEVTLSPVDLSDGYGNFYMKPNGIFLIKEDNTAAVINSAAFEQTNDIRYALQSGPLLILNNEIPDILLPNSDVSYIRSAVGVTDSGDIIFAISNEPVILYQLAHLLKDEYHCTDALYLDGAISKMYVKDEREELGEDFGAMIGISENM